jgi:hypothetical protein
MYWVGSGVTRAFFLHYRWEISEDFSGECKIGGDYMFLESEIFPLIDPE